MSDTPPTTSETPMYPIMEGPSVPWEVMAPHEAMAMKNHSQTLTRLAQRGGLSSAEAWCVVSGIKLTGLEREKWKEWEAAWIKFANETNQRYSALHQQLTTALARVKELEKDKERLDWLEKSSEEQVQILMLQDGGICLSTGQDDGEDYHGESARQAIDSAMQQGKETR